MAVRSLYTVSRIARVKVRRRDERGRCVGKVKVAKVIADFLCASLDESEIGG